MYILVVRKNKEIVFQKEYKTFEDLMKKFDSFDFEKENLVYNIYKNMEVIEIVKEYCLFDKDAKEVMTDLLKVIKEL